MRVKNETRWRTDQIRALIRRVARDELDPGQLKNACVNIKYKRSNSHIHGRCPCGTATAPRVNMTLYLPRPPFEVNSVQLAFTIAHEFAHAKGFGHRDMRGLRYLPVSGWKERYAYAADFPIELRPEAKPKGNRYRPRPASQCRKPDNLTNPNRRACVHFRSRCVPPGENTMESQLLAHCGSDKLSREDLKQISTPPETPTHKPVAHHVVVESLIETLGFRHIGVVRDEYAVSKDGMRLFGVLDLETTFDGCRFSIGVRNANDKSMRLAMTVGYHVLICDNMAFHGDFTPVLAKHTKRLSLMDALSVGVDRMQRNFEPMQRQIEAWKQTQLADNEAKLLIYRAFVEGELEIPKHLATTVHGLYFDPRESAFASRSMWSLSNAFTGALKLLDPIPRFKVTAKLGTFLAEVARPGTFLPGEAKPETFQAGVQ